ncbi:uncharacterized protein LOC132395789 [Hypanus sabinus]|uniref:uncharacterized protein LOC132395789 n=1 Tax=Hypanus sabinus TaxID=79690 RepID=UPI0028C4CBBC|nr:uncharacterized protein LOC132395789 [Hypanus sabinus]
MGPVVKDTLGVIILLSVWTGTAGKVSITVEKLSSKGSPCQLEIRCSKKMSFEKFQWHEGDMLVSNDDRHKVTFGGMLLTVSPDHTNTQYKCSLEKSPEEQMSVDVAPTCGFTDPTVTKTGSLGGCSRGLLAMKIALLCLWLGILGYTFYYCNRKTSQKATGKNTKVTEEGIYSHVGMSDLGAEDNPQQEEEKPGPSQDKQTVNPTYQSLQKTEKNNDYSMLTPVATAASAQDPMYQALVKDEDNTYNTLQKPAAGSEPTVTFSATMEEVSLQEEAKT